MRLVVKIDEFREKKFTAVSLWLRQIVVPIQTVTFTCASVIWWLVF